MACYQPVKVPILRKSTFKFGRFRDLQEVGCGHCIGCRADQARDWSFRIMHEASMHEDSWFVTLTYSDDRIPQNGSLDPSHFQRFIKALRRRYPPRSVSFYGVGEYGEKTHRPHYHAVLFGADFLDRIYIGDRNGYPIWRAPSLENDWGHGICEFSTVTPASAAYTAGYVRKKISAKVDPDAYERCDPDTGELVTIEKEFSRMSLKPAVGLRWIKKYWRDVYPADMVVMDGKEFKPPRYYDTFMDFPDEKGGSEERRRIMMEVREKRIDEVIDLDDYKRKAKRRKHEWRIETYQQRDAI